MPEKLSPEAPGAAVDRVLAKLRESIGTGTKLRGWAGAVAAVPLVVEVVEVVGKEVGFVGTDKKAIAVAAVLKLVPDRWVPDWIIAPFIVWGIDKAVEAMKGGKLADLIADVRKRFKL